MTFLVTGATGAQGGAITRRLLAEGHQVRGFSRSGGLPYGMEAFTGDMETFTGDLADTDAVKAAFTGVTHAAVTLPMIYDPAVVSIFVRNIRDAALAVGVRRLVLNTGNRLPQAPTGIAAFETRRQAVRDLQEAGLPLVVLCPPIYLDNLAAPWVAGPLAAEGVLRYPLPADVPVSWLSHDDLAALTHAALTTDGLDGAVLNVGGAEALTGDQLAAALGARYAAQDLTTFESGLAAMAGADTAAEVAATYRWAAANPGLFAADPSALDRLGVRPASVDTWIAAQPWTRR